jgi:FkbM family methyltransferase
MKPQPRPAAFVLAATDQGAMIVNRFDRHMLAPGQGIGVGYNLLETCAYDPDEVGVGVALLEMARIFRGGGVVAVDCGANLGVHTVQWARAMTGWGTVLAFEAQERVFYALAGNVALNNCFNARVRHAAVAAACGVIRVPQPDYCRDGSFGSLEVRPSAAAEFIGQPIDYAAGAEVPSLSLDSLQLPRLDLIKIDVEGMELEVLEGARACLARCHPLLIVEALKIDRGAPRLQAWLEAQGYCVFGMGANFVAVHQADPIRAQIRPGAPPPNTATAPAPPTAAGIQESPLEIGVA